jgi:hypothetical protein
MAQNRTLPGSDKSVSGVVGRTVLARGRATWRRTAGSGFAVTAGAAVAGGAGGSGGGWIGRIKPPGTRSSAAAPGPQQTPAKPNATATTMANALTIDGISGKTLPL